MVQESKTTKEKKVHLHLYQSEAHQQHKLTLVAVYSVVGQGVDV
jgi:hypothetical protein